MGITVSALWYEGDVPWIPAQRSLAADVMYFARCIARSSGGHFALDLRSAITGRLKAHFLHCPRAAEIMGGVKLSEG